MKLHRQLRYEKYLTFWYPLERINAGLEDGQQFTLLYRLRHIGQHVPVRNQSIQLPLECLKQLDVTFSVLLCMAHGQEISAWFPLKSLGDGGYFLLRSNPSNTLSYCPKTNTANNNVYTIKSKTKDLIMKIIELEVVEPYSKCPFGNRHSKQPI